MNFAMVGATVRFAASRMGLVMRKYAPQIMVGTGVVGFVGTVVVGCRATLKAEDVLDKRDEMLAKTEEAREAHSEDGQYTEEDYKKDKQMITVKTAWNFVKLYAPTVTLGAASIALVLGGNHILAARNAAIAAAYKAAEEGFRQYRKNVVDNFGKDVDYQMRNGLKAEEMQKLKEEKKELAEAKKEGKSAEKKALKKVHNSGNHSIYSRIFDEYSTQYRNDPTLMLSFLYLMQSHANDMLRVRGHVFLNEVYEMLGFEHTKEGCVVGWVLDKDNGSDNYIDFGLENTSEESLRELIARKQEKPYVWLDFNVDGVIYDLI